MLDEYYILILQERYNERMRELERQIRLAEFLAGADRPSNPATVIRNRIGNLLVALGTRLLVPAA